MYVEHRIIKVNIFHIFIVGMLFVDDFGGILFIG